MLFWACLSKRCKISEIKLYFEFMIHENNVMLVIIAARSVGALSAAPLPNHTSLFS